MNDLKRRFFLKMPNLSDRIITFSVLALSVFSILMVTSASMGKNAGDIKLLIIVIIKQLIFLVVGYLMMVLLANRFKLEKYMKIIRPLFVFMVFLLIIPRFFRPIGGTYGWIVVPLSVVEVTLQPAEFAKLFIIIFLAIMTSFLDYKKIDHQMVVIKMLGGIAAIFILVLFVEKDFGSAVALLGISSLTYISISNKYTLKTRKFITGLIVFVFILAILSFLPGFNGFLHKIFGDSYRINRFLSAANPFENRYSYGYHLVIGLVAMASGGIFGLGYGNGIGKYGRFPAADTDFILAVIIEELGIFGFLFVLILYMIIIIRLFKYVFKINDNSSRVILVGTAMYLTIHFILNVGGVSGFIPLTGVPLLLVSSGGSSMVAFMMAIGISQNIITKFKMGIIK